MDSETREMFRLILEKLGTLESRFESMESRSESMESRFETMELRQDEIYQVVRAIEMDI